MSNGDRAYLERARRKANGRCTGWMRVGECPIGDVHMVNSAVTLVGVSKGSDLPLYPSRAAREVMTAAIDALRLFRTPLPTITAESQRNCLPSPGSSLHGRHRSNSEQIFIFVAGEVQISTSQ
ncbi:hypothetical protein K438DRAFT_1777319 [Mycena galopus ATCC 62051]|nr:hypothetical protein K438DRAFT_1777319 [Mycena galopus ATCC 62051]